MYHPEVYKPYSEIERVLFRISRFMYQCHLTNQQEIHDGSWRPPWDSSMLE